MKGWKIKYQLVTCPAVNITKNYAAKKVKDLFRESVLLNAVKKAGDGFTSNAVVTILNSFFEKIV